MSSEFESFVELPIYVHDIRIGKATCFQTCYDFSSGLFLKILSTKLRLLYLPGACSKIRLDGEFGSLDVQMYFSR